MFTEFRLRWRRYCWTDGRIGQDQKGKSIGESTAWCCTGRRAGKWSLLHVLQLICGLRNEFLRRLHLRFGQSFIIEELLDSRKNQYLLSQSQHINFRKWKILDPKSNRKVCVWTQDRVLEQRYHCIWLLKSTFEEGANRMANPLPSSPSVKES